MDLFFANFYGDDMDVDVSYDDDDDDDDDLFRLSDADSDDSYPDNLLRGPDYESDFLDSIYDNQYLLMSTFANLQNFHPTSHVSKKLDKLHFSLENLFIDKQRLIFRNVVGTDLLQTAMYLTEDSLHFALFTMQETASLNDIDSKTLSRIQCFVIAIYNRLRATDQNQSADFSSCLKNIQRKLKYLTALKKHLSSRSVS